MAFLTTVTTDSYDNFALISQINTQLKQSDYSASR